MNSNLVISSEFPDLTSPRPQVLAKLVVVCLQALNSKLGYSILWSSSTLHMLTASEWFHNGSSQCRVWSSHRPRSDCWCLSDRSRCPGHYAWRTRQCPKSQTTFGCSHYPSASGPWSHFAIPSSLHICGRILESNSVGQFLYLKFMFFVIEFA